VTGLASRRGAGMGLAEGNRGLARAFGAPICTWFDEQGGQMRLVCPGCCIAGDLAGVEGRKSFMLGTGPIDWSMSVAQLSCACSCGTGLTAVLAVGDGEHVVSSSSCFRILHSPSIGSCTLLPTSTLSQLDLCLSSLCSCLSQLSSILSSSSVSNSSRSAPSSLALSCSFALLSRFSSLSSLSSALSHCPILDVLFKSVPVVVVVL
jgi:hypothetical protein